MTRSWFDGVEDIPLPPAFVLFERYEKDEYRGKVCLLFGSYHDDEGRTIPLPVVKHVEQLIVNDPNDTYDYLPAKGMVSFCNAATAVVLGRNNPRVEKQEVISIQAMSGTNALHFAARFLVLSVPAVRKTVYLSKQTWGNHQYVFGYAGFNEIRSYRYCNYDTMGLDLEGMLEDLKGAEAGSVVVLQPCSHNPTGVDPKREEWRKILDVIKEASLFVVWDCAFQGFASGDLDEDAWPIRLFADEGLEFLVAQTFSKIFCLDSHRPGNLIAVTQTAAAAVRVKDHLTALARSSYNNPPSHGARIVSMILNDPKLEEQWRDCVRNMVSRIRRVRKDLRDKLEALTEPGKWKFLTDQQGLFVFSGLNPQHVEFMAAEYNVYVQHSGRLNICGVNGSNVERVGKAMVDAIQKIE